METLLHPLYIKFTLLENAMQEHKNGDCAAGFYAKLLS